MQTLIAGANAPLSAATITIRVQSAADIDVAAYRLAANDKVRGDGDMIFYGQTQSDDGSVRFSGNERDGHFQLNLAQQPSAIERIAIAFSAAVPVAQLGNVQLSIQENGTTTIECPLPLSGRQEKALILGECYRRNGQWKFRFVAQGFNGGLKPLSEHFGVEISDDASNAANPAPPPQSSPQSSSQSPPSPLNLNKITLDKAKPSLTLDKKADFGQIRINLNWQRGSQATSGGFLKSLLGGNQGVDLDLGAFIRLKNGQKDCVQALGGNFGNLQQAPFVKLQGDDRTGAVAEGEWLDVNGSQWQAIDEVLIYAFIYQGVPNWDATDGVVKLFVQGQEIETRLSEGSSRHPMCAVARLINRNGSIFVERINRYFNGHRELDQAFGWGFSWQAGRK